MEKMKLPPGWTSVLNESRWKKPYGWCSKSEKRIDIYPPKWIPSLFGIRKYFEGIIYAHEALHAWGSPGCNSPWCLGYEGETGMEYLAMPIQFLALLRFCDVCRSFYKG